MGARAMIASSSCSSRVGARSVVSSSGAGSATEGGVLDRRLALHRPADPKRHRPSRCALHQRAQRLRRHGARGHAILGRHADGELFGQRAERGHELGRVTLRGGGSEPRAQVLDVDLRLGVHGEADLDRLRVDAEREEGVALVRAGVVDLRRDRATAIEEPIELVAGGLIAPQEDPLAVDALPVAQRRVLVRAVHVHRDAELAEARDHRAGPPECALLHLQPRARVGVRRRLLWRVGVEVTSGEVQCGMAHGVRL